MPNTAPRMYSMEVWTLKAFAHALTSGGREKKHYFKFDSKIFNINLNIHESYNSEM